MLTQRQLQLLRFIHRHVAEHGVCPSFEEMRAALQLKSKSGIHRLVSGLEERGYIRRLAYRARAVDILRPPPMEASQASGERDSSAPASHASRSFEPERRAAEHATPGAPPSQGDNIVRGNFRAAPRRFVAAAPSSNCLPLIGRIAAGSPIEALPDVDNTIDVPGILLGEGEHYVVEVTGNSMIDAGIMDGDLAVIQRCETAENGAIVVALVEDREVTLKRFRRRGASIALEPANPDYEIRIFGPHQVRVQGRLVGLLRRT